MSIKDRFSQNIQKIKKKREASKVRKKKNTNIHGKTGSVRLSTGRSTALLRTGGPVVFTGAGPQPRHIMIAYANRAGYTVENRVHYRTNYLITDNPNRMTVKRRAAIRYGIPIISYSQFLDGIDRS